MNIGRLTLGVVIGLGLYTAGEYTQGEEIRLSLTAEDYHNQTSLSRGEVMALVGSAQSLDIAVLIQTKKQDGLIANYGYRLSTFKDYNANFNANVNTKESRYIDFDKKFMTHYAPTFFRSVIGVTEDGYSLGVYPRELDIDISMFEERRLPESMSVPFISAYNTTLKPVDAIRLDGESYVTSRSLYTPSRLDGNFNPYSGALTDEKSYRFIEKGSKFRSTLILSESDKQVVGVYLEEHGVDDRSALLKMLEITLPN